MNSLNRSEAILAAFQLVLISVLLAGPVVSLWAAPGASTWCALVLLPAASVLISLGCQHRRVPATLRIRGRMPSTGSFSPAVA